MTPLPLEGRRVLVTRAAHQASKLSDGLRAQGADPVEVPVLEIQPPESFEALDHGLRRLGEYDWLILTSANTVRALAEHAAALGLPLSASPPLRVAAVGEATAEAARTAGFAISVVPGTYVAEALVECLAGQIAGKKILLARAAIARDVIPDALREAGGHVDVVDTYRNVLPEAAPELLRRALVAGIGAGIDAGIGAGIDAATFTSSSSVTHLADAARRAGIAFPFPGVPAVSIGPITSGTLREFGWEPAAEASPSDIPGLIAATVLALT